MSVRAAIRVLARVRPGPLSAPAAGLLLALAPFASPASEKPGGTGEVFRIVFSRTLFTEVNENDAKASLKVWTNTIAEELKTNRVAETAILGDLDAIHRGLVEERIDAAAVTLPEFVRIEKDVPIGAMFIPSRGGRQTEEYLILVHRDSGIGSVAELRDRSMIVYENPRTSLADVWMESLFEGLGLGSVLETAASVGRVTKLTACVLPVFFRQADACLVTREGLGVMTELNPRVGRDLVPIAASPKVVSMVFFIRGTVDADLLEDLRISIRRTAHTPGGQQVLTLFQSDEVLEAGMDELAPSRRLLSAAGNRPATGVLESVRSPASRPTGTRVRTAP